MRPIRAVLLLCLLPAALAAAEPARPGKIALSELSFAGIELGDSQAQVRKKLGKPTKTTGQADSYEHVFRYPGLDVTFFGDDVAGLSSSSPKRCTPSGACPGQTLVQAHARLGRGAPPVPVDGRVEYYVEDETCWLRLDLGAGGRIETLAVVCLP
ncbi:hypothetical protein [Pseudomonas sp. CGJS7]|uniref:hypothetical protein n=1 Tax=Pseudomonas sp. CGJS7 TaxID=3109348 RepID=UPI00300B7344